MTADPDVERILVWPAETWSPAEVQRVQERRSALHREQFALADQAERDGRNLSPEERAAFDAIQAEYDRLSSAVPSQR
jgi:hypothetical protein